LESLNGINILEDAGAYGKILQWRLKNTVSHEAVSWADVTQGRNKWRPLVNLRDP
jgi:hypothetical protein